MERARRPRLVKKVVAKVIMPEGNSIISLLATALALLATGLGTMVLFFMSGLRKDIHDLVIKVETTQKDMAVKFDKQQEQITEVRVGMAKMQEQMYTMLRGGPPMTAERSERGGT